MCGQEQGEAGAPDRSQGRGGLGGYFAGDLQVLRCELGLIVRQR